MKRILFFIILFIPLSFAVTEIQVDFSSGISLEKEQYFSEINSVVADLFLFPREEFGQEVLSLKTGGKQGLDEINYKWDVPKQNVLAYSYTSVVRTNHDLRKVFSKINYPYPKLSGSIEYFTQPSEHIDSQYETIKDLAQKIREQETDSWKIVNKIGLWVKGSVKYNLSTLTEDVVQRASWVLQNKYGVCDEITTLFIALVRSLGIPARFVHGVAQTDGNGLFGSHGWAEVYFPNHGWVPFDVTFGQFGWIDETHVRLMHTLDPGDPGVKVEWRGKNVEAKLGKLALNAKFLRHDKEEHALLDYSISPQFSLVKHGGYNLIIVSIKNPQSFYVTESFTLSSVKELDILGLQEQWAILAPGEETRLFYIIKIIDNLPEKFQYTVPIVVTSGRDQLKKSIFKITPSGVAENLRSIENTIILLRQENLKQYSSQVLLFCTPKQELLFENDVPEIECTLENKGNLILNNVEVCAINKCSEIDISPKNKITVILKLNLQHPGRQDVLVTANNDLISKNSMVSLEKYDDTILEIEEVSFPEKIVSETSLKLKLVQKSYSSPAKVSLIVRTPKRKIISEIKEFLYEQELEVSIKPEDFAYGKNDLKIELDYKTLLGEDKNDLKILSVERGAGGFLKSLLLNIQEFFTKVWEVIWQ
ncbi:transglutaminase domain-containing protein [Candidatus Woesearchaeota archaeon]|nr:transglutaminase domain-containing protein [Candidatus Woesearchaeota archaeon]